ncbi:putative N-alkane-inducible cytochrome P450 [Astrocystis sublimbata]|nr:putative N-alkane-inducible cytochrome P450 [Astrocystis sublimbata]KAI0206177.1 putative N-alkane-inducible cytochrome P450 [Astrocystis sublimbata]
MQGHTELHPGRLLLFFIAIALTIGIIRKSIRYLAISRFKRKHQCLPARRVPQVERLIGLRAYLDLKRERKERISLQETTRRAHQYGRTTTGTVLGTRFLSTCDPANVKALLATNFGDFSVGPRLPVLGPLLGRGVFTLDDVPWQHSRALLRPAFTRSQIGDPGSLEEHVQKLFACLPSVEGTVVDLQPLFFNLTIDSSTDFLLGRSVGTQGSPPGSEPARFSEAFDYAESVLQRRTELAGLAWLVYDRRFNEACRTIHDFVDKYIYAALQGDIKTGGYNLLAELAGECKDPIRIREELLNVLLAARDTTASLLSSVCYLLARNPATWARLAEEVAELNGRKPHYELLKGMRYLKSVLSETLRLFPPVPTNMRFARVDTTLPRGGGPDGLSPVFIPKDSRVFYSTWTMHRLPEIWGDDAEEFRPERWMNEEVHLRPGWGYIPFNGGPRICIGQQKALYEASYIVVRLVQTFARLEPRDSQPWQEHVALTLSNVHGTKVALWKRPEVEETPKSNPGD